MLGNLLSEKMPQFDHGGCIVMGNVEIGHYQAVVVAVDEHAALKAAVHISLCIVHAGVERP